MIFCWQYTKALLFVISIYNESSGRKISVMIDCLLNTTRQSNITVINNCHKDPHYENVFICPMSL